MANTDQEIAEQFLTGIQQEIIRRHVSLGQRASGETIKGLRVQTIPTGAQLIGPAHIGALEDGRGPTRGGGGGGGQSLQSRIFDWLAFKKYGIGYANDKERLSLSFAISRVIHEEGTLLFRERTESGLLSQIITAQRLQALTGAFARNKSIEFGSEILKPFQ